jgi:hypothetical protein
MLGSATALDAKPSARHETANASVRFMEELPRGLVRTDSEDARITLSVGGQIAAVEAGE